MATYNNKKDIFEAIDDNHRIHGVVEVDFDYLLDVSDLDEINDVFTDGLIGEDA